MSLRCTVCSHPSVKQIDRALVEGVSYRSLAARYGLTESSISRHKRNGHISSKIAKAAERRELKSADDLLHDIEQLLTQATASIAAAEESGDEAIKLRAIREARETARILLEAHGEISTAATVNVTLVENQFNELRMLVLDGLCPECRARLVDELQKRRTIQDVPEKRS